MLEKVKIAVIELSNQDKSGHGDDHIMRVYELALRFAELENADKYIVGLSALLHDVDDYKMVGKENADKLLNAKRIMNEVNIDNDTQSIVLDIIKNMGYSKSLKGIRPISLEGKIVSDADMCDAMGASGIIRAVVYAVSDIGSGTIFNKSIFPNINITAKEYNSNFTTHDNDNAINHFFEKLLKLRNMMMTKSGKNEAIERHKIMIDFLNHFFEEENVPEWKDFLNDYLKKFDSL